MFTKLRCKRFQKEQKDRRAEVIRLTGEVGKVTSRIHVSRIEGETNILSFENTRLFGRLNILLSDIRDTLSDIRTEESIHKLNCPKH